MKAHKPPLTLAFVSCALLVGALVSAAAPVAGASTAGSGRARGLDNAADDMGSLTGYVQDAFRRTAIAGATVIFSSSSARLPNGTDLSGKYLFPNLPAGNGTVTASAEGYTSQTINGKIIANQLTQAPDILLAPVTPIWNKAFGGTGDDQLWSIAQVSDGGYITAGSTDPFGTGLYDGWVIKLDASGNQMWSKTFGGSTSYDYLYSIAPTSDGGYITAGQTESEETDGWVLKLDANGNVVWSKTYIGSGYDYLTSIAPASDGSYIAAGYTIAGAYQDWEGWVLKLDANGNEVWNKTYGGSEDDTLASIAPTSDGGYVAAGNTYSFGAGSGAGWVIRLDGSGNQAWSKTFDTRLDDELEQIVPTGDGGYIAAGFLFAEYQVKLAYIGWIVKLDANGNEVWNKKFGANDPAPHTVLNSVSPSPDGGYVTAGYKNTVGSCTDGLAVKLDASGSEVWHKGFGGVECGDAFWAAVPTKDAGYIAAGKTISFGAGGDDGWIVKMDANGNTGPNPPLARGNAGGDILTPH